MAPLKLFPGFPAVGHKPKPKKNQYLKHRRHGIYKVYVRNFKGDVDAGGKGPDYAADGNDTVGSLPPKAAENGGDDKADRAAVYKNQPLSRKATASMK